MAQYLKPFDLDATEQRRKSIHDKISSNPFEECLRCGGNVYPLEKLGPIQGRVFHRNCFRCSICKGCLTLKNYRLNQGNPNDREVYCANHVPKTVTAVNIIGDMTLKSALDAQRLQRTVKKDLQPHHYPPLPPGKRVRGTTLEESQSALELQHRDEETKLLNHVAEERNRELKKMEESLEVEFQIGVAEISKKFQTIKKQKGTIDSKDMEQDLTALKESILKKGDETKRTLTQKLREEERKRTSLLVQKQSYEMLEMISDMKRRLSTIIDSSSENAKLPEPDYSPVGSRSNSPIDDSDHKSENVILREKIPTIIIDSPLIDLSQRELPPIPDDIVDANQNHYSTISGVDTLLPTSKLPQIGPPKCLKKEIYTNTEVFREIDDNALKVADTDFPSYTQLVKRLTENARSELEKVRAIFIWITHKNLSEINFDDYMHENQDSPFGLLRGIKYGTESYHTLFMRLCSYAGIYCVEVNGFSKSVGYEPGMSFDDHKFTNTWNVVLVEGSWRLIQCHWAARMLTFSRNHPEVHSNCQDGGHCSASITDNSANSNINNVLKYKYDEHYFLTDPEDYIYEFFPYDKKWQLLKDPITREEFENLPFVRSNFFKLALKFPKSTRAVVSADDSGKAYLEIWADNTAYTVCHYQFRYADDGLKGSTHYAGEHLDNFIFFSVKADRFAFDIHLPSQNSFILEIFAAEIPHLNNPQIISDKIKLESVAKFKIQAPATMSTRMKSLPGSGEWGPAKAVRQYNIKPVNYPSAAINENAPFNVKLILPNELKKYNYFAALRKRQVNMHLLANTVETKKENCLLNIAVHPPVSGQYALEIFLQKDSNSSDSKQSRVCKYLVNYTSNMQRTQTLDMQPEVEPENTTKVTPGPRPSHKKLGIQLSSQQKPSFTTMDDKIELSFTWENSELTLAYKLLCGYPEETIGDYSDCVVAEFTPMSLTCHLPLLFPATFDFHLYARKKEEDFEPFQSVHVIRITKEVQTVSSLLRQKSMKKK